MRRGAWFSLPEISAETAGILRLGCVAPNGAGSAVRSVSRCEEDDVIPPRLAGQDDVFFIPGVCPLAVWASKFMLAQLGISPSFFLHRLTGRDEFCSRGATDEKTFGHGLVLNSISRKNTDALRTGRRREKSSLATWSAELTRALFARLRFVHSQGAALQLGAIDRIHRRGRGDVVRHGDETEAT